MGSSPRSASLLHPIPLLLLGGLLLVAGCDASVDLQQGDADPTSRTVPADSSGLALAPMPTGSELLTPGAPAPKSNADASAYGCYLASRPYSDEVAFHSKYLHFPEEVIEDAGGQTRAVARYMAVSRPGMREEVGVRYATCVIPDTDEAEGVLEEQLLYPGLENANQQALQDQGLIPKSTCTQLIYHITCVGPTGGDFATCHVAYVEEVPVPCGGGSPPTGGDPQDPGGFPDDPGGPGGSDGDEPGGGDNNADCTEINPPPGSDCEPVDPCESDNPPANCDGEEDEFPCELSTSDLSDEHLFAAADEEDLEKFIETLEEYGADFGLDTSEQVNHFLGQTAHETGGAITVAEEAGVFTSIYDTEEKLRENSDLIGPDAEFAAEDVLGDAELIANIMRANKYGNGDYSSGDGWAYRGRGLIQLTWKGAYQNFTAFYQNEGYGTEDFTEDPEKLSNDAEAGTLAALWFWDNRVMNHSVIDEDDLNVEDITEAINGPGKFGLEDREDRTEAAENNTDCS